MTGLPLPNQSCRFLSTLTRLMETANPAFSVRWDNSVSYLASKRSRNRQCRVRHYVHFAKTFVPETLNKSRVSEKGWLKNNRQFIATTVELFSPQSSLGCRKFPVGESSMSDRNPLIGNSRSPGCLVRKFRPDCVPPALPVLREF